MVASEKRSGGHWNGWALIAIVVIGVTAIYFWERSNKRSLPPSSANAALSPLNPQASLIESKGLQELSSENNIPANTLSAENKELGEAVMSSLQLAGDGKDRAKTHQAIAAVSALIQQHPDYADAYVLRATYSLMSSEPDLELIPHDLDASLRYHSSHKYDSAYSSEASIYSLRAKADVLAGNYQQAMIDLESAVQVDPSSPNEVFNTGGVKPEEDANPTALNREDLAMLVSKYPRDFRAYMFRGLFYASFTTYGEQYYAPTFADLNRALEINPNSALIHYFLGRIAQKMTFWTEASARDISDITGARGGYKVKTHRRALQHFDAAIQLDPKFALAYADAAEELLSLKRYSDAVPYYDRAIDLRPDDADTYNDRGLAKSKLGNYYEAISDYSQAIELKKRQNARSLDSTYENRAVAYSKTGNHDAAIEDYSRAIGLKFREQVFLMSVPQIRAIYPELSDISDHDLLEGLRQKYFPNMSSADFVGNYQKKDKPFEDFVLAELYVDRGDTYLAAGNFRKASHEYGRAVHDDKSYAIDRWRPISKSLDTQYLADVQTFDFTQGNIVSLWVKAQKAKSETYNQTNYQIDCRGRKIRGSSSVNYDSAGNPRNSLRDQEWESIAPETVGELLYKGMCT